MLCIAGKNNIAVEIVEHALEKMGIENILLVTNSPDSGEDSWQRSLLKYGRENNLKVIGLEEAYDIEDLIFLSLEFDKIIKPHFFKSDKLYNIHFSLLPKYKGMYTSYWPLVNGEYNSGVTLHKIDSGIDTGDIIANKRIIINEDMTCKELYCEYLKSGIELVKNNFDNIINFKLNSYQQPFKESSYYSRSSIDYSNIQLNLNQTAYNIKNQVRALNFRDYQLPTLNKHYVTHVDILNMKSKERAGTILREDDLSFEISTIDYNIVVYKDKLLDLLKCCEYGEVDKLKLFLKCKYNINEQNEKGWTPLIVACYNGRYEIVNLLLEHGADSNLTNYKGTTPLMYAKDYCIENNDYKILNLLISKGANIEKKDYENKDIFDYLKLKYSNKKIEEIKSILNVS